MASTAARRPPRWRLWLDLALAVAGISIAVWRVGPILAGVPALPKRLVALHQGWLVIAVVLAFGALVAYGELHRLLLRAAGSSLPGRTVQVVTFIGNAVTDTVPSAGTVAGGAYTMVALRNRGVDTPTAAWTVAMGGLIAAVTLAVAAPLLLAADGLVSLRIAVVLSVVASVVAWLLVVMVRRPRMVNALARAVAAIARHLPGVRRTGWAAQQRASLERFATDISRIRPTGLQWIAFLTVSMLSWALDYVVLVACVAATGAAVSWLSVAAGFLAVQISIGLQLTPNGTGPAEAGLLAALVAGGIPPGQAAIVVVVYRVITWIMLALVGWIMFLCSAARRSAVRATS